MANTITDYAIPKDVENFLILQHAIDQNSVPNEEVFESYILMAQGEFESRTGTAYRPVFVQHEVHDLVAWRARHREVFNDAQWLTKRPIHLHHRPTIPFSSARGHKIEVYEGESAAPTAAIPEGEWNTEYLTDKNFGREQDWWVDWQKGHLYIRKSFIYRRASLVRVSYEYGKSITTLNGALTSSATTITVASTHNYQTRGWIRVGREYIFHTGKTTTTFTGCTRGVLKTTAVAHSDGVEVYEVPDNIRRLVTMRAAASFLENEVFVSVVGDNAGTAPTFGEKIRNWNDQWERALSSTYQRWGSA